MQRVALLGFALLGMFRRDRRCCFIRPGSACGVAMAVPASIGSALQLWASVLQGGLRGAQQGVGGAAQAGVVIVVHGEHCGAAQAVVQRELDLQRDGKG